MRASRIISMAFTALPIAACSGASEGTSTSQDALTGPIEMRAINSDQSSFVAGAALDPNLGALSKIVVTVARVEAKVDVDADGHERGDDAWVTVSTGPFTVDLLSLEGSGFASLGVAQLPAGRMDALRLVLDSAGPDYVVTAAGATFPLVVPSGDEAGIRVIGDFDAQACATGHVTLEFAGRHSIVVRLDADGDAYLLRPVIHVREIVASGACPDTDPDRHGHER